MDGLHTHEKSLIALGRRLREDGYRFTTVTPASHGRILARRGSESLRALRDVFGWNRPFRENHIPSDIFSLMRETGVLDPYDVSCGSYFVSRVRFSTLGEDIYVHSSFPTTAPDSVFFGPDTYRFATQIRAELEALPVSRSSLADPGLAMQIVDVGCGTGAGGIVAFRCFQALGQNARLTFADINPRALSFARVNAELADLNELNFLQSDLFQKVEDVADVILANSPYLVDPERRLYRHGGETGFELSMRIVEEGLPKLKSGGLLLLYTGAPVVDGHDLFWQALKESPVLGGKRFRYQEIDPDVFGEELARPEYHAVERIAAVSLAVCA